jgi:hypothetical protein
MILLPKIRAAYLKSFALVMGLALGLIAAVLLLLPRHEEIGVVVAITGLGCAVLGFFKPSAMAKPYGLWNAVAGSFARAARLALMAICFYIVFVAVGRAGTSIKLLRPGPGDSLWSFKMPLARSAFHYEYRASTDSDRDISWVQGYGRWAKETKQIWTLVLLPFLVMLSAVEIYVDRRFPTGVYTLF